MKNFLQKIGNFFKVLAAKITGKKVVYSFKDKNKDPKATEIKAASKRVEETPHVTEFNVWSNAVPEVLNETKTVKEEVKTDYTTMTMEELREFAGKHNILVKPADSKEYIISLIEKHVKDHH
jgi:hypothetical protein